MKKFLKLLLVLIVLGAAGYYGWQYYQQNFSSPASAPAAARNAYTEYTIARGNLSKNVTGTGTLSIARTEDIALPYAVIVTDALVEEGDIISIDIPACKIELKVSDEELARRRAAWVCPEPKVKTGYLARYAKLVSSASKGAVLE